MNRSTTLRFCLALIAATALADTACSNDGDGEPCGDIAVYALTVDILPQGPRGCDATVVAVDAAGTRQTLTLDADLADDKTCRTISLTALGDTLCERGRVRSTVVTFDAPYREIRI